MTGPVDDRDRARRELDRELAFHRQATLEDLKERGLSDEEAERALAHRFGDADRWRWRILRADVARPRTGTAMAAAARRQAAGLARDVRDGVRSLRASPLFTASAVAVFALVAVAGTVAAAVVSGVLLSPMPYPDASRLFYVWGRNANVRAGFVNLPVSDPDLADWRRGATGVSAVGGVVPESITLTGDGDPERVPAVAVTGDLFEALGVAPLHGRPLRAADGLEGARPVVVIGFDLWQRRFGGDPAAIGRVLTLNDRSFELVGVMPRGFAFPRVDEVTASYGIERDIAAWVPWRPGGAGPVTRGNRYLIVAARLAPATAPGDAERELTALSTAALGPDADRSGDRFALVSFRDQAVSGVRATLWLLSAAVVLLVAIAALNLAHLLLVRVGDRRRQFAIRTALGAGWTSLVRQVAVESVLLSCAGGLVGLAGAAGALGVVRRMAPADFPRVPTIQLSGGVAVFSGVALVGCALLVGLVAAFGLRRVSVQRDLVATSRAHSGSGRGGRLLVGAEIALGVLILLAGGLVLESFRKVLGTDAGFDSRGVLSFRVTLPTARYPTAGDVRAGYDAIAAALLPLPGTRGAAYTWQLPMAGMQGSAGYTRATGEGAMALIHRVSPSYFETMGMRLVHGCGLDCDTDRPPIVVNESLARLQWSDRDPVGALVTVNGVESRITGIVNDVRHGSLETAPTPELYQHGFLRTMFVVVRSTRPAPDLVPAVRAAVRAIDPALALSDVRTLDDRMAATVARRRFTLVALASFAILAALLALVGTYGVTALIVARRRREVAIRLALGATAGGAVGWMVGRQMPVLAGGVLTGAAGALALGRVFEPFLYQTSPFEPAVYLMVTAMMAFAALLATVLPARRIAAVSPLEALQSE